MSDIVIYAGIHNQAGSIRMLRLGRGLSLMSSTPQTLLYWGSLRRIHPASFTSARKHLEAVLYQERIQLWINK